MKKINKYSIGIVISFAMSILSCKYLDYVPDNVATIDHAFSNRLEAEKYLYTCYSYLPADNDPFGSIGLTGGDETWTYHPQTEHNGWLPLEIVKGYQNVNDPYMNFWSGEKGGKGLYKAIRDCNIFLENVSNESKVYDLEPYMRTRWIAEVQFLKAYYHFYLFRMYGPIVIVDKNTSVSAPSPELQRKRSPVDEVVKYISDQLDAATTGLPDFIRDHATEAGRITKAIAVSLKAKLLVTAASPLFNGNSDYAGFSDKDGVLLFNSQYDQQKWEKAAEVAKQAIDLCHASGNSLYKFVSSANLTDTTVTQMSIRNSVCEKWNTEIVWGGRAVGDLQRLCMARVDPSNLQNYYSGREILNPTLNISNLFYSVHGVPIDEDKTWNFSERFSPRKATGYDRFNLIDKYETISLQFDREHRYYADLAFDGSLWFLYRNQLTDKTGVWGVKAKKGQPQSSAGAIFYSVTGLWIKKLVNWKYVIGSDKPTIESYPWPAIRLADLYLLYAEALNEAGNPAEALVWIDKVRNRAGLKGVEESWRTYSVNPAKFSSKEGLREIIQRERAIELIFEGSRFWDLRRWKTANEALNQGIYGWNLEGESVQAYYQPKLLYDQKFVAPRDYLFPLKQSDLIDNPRLVQNPGW